MAVPPPLSADPGERAARVEARLATPMLVVTLLMLPLFVLEESGGGPGRREVASGLNWFVWSAFLAETVVMLALVPERRAWLRAHPLEAAVVVLTPPLLPAGLQSLRVLRLLRLVRLLALWERLRRALTPEGLRHAALVAVLVLVGGGVTFSALEPGVSSWDGIWWAATTMTTVGYGDVVPHTTAGRLLALAVMFVGIGFGTLVIAGLANSFVSRTLGAEVERVEELELEVEEAEADLAAEIRAVRQRLEELEQMVTRRRAADG